MGTRCRVLHRSSAGFITRKQILSTQIIEERHDLLRSSPALYLGEIASWIAVTYGQPVSISTVQRSLRTLGYPVKKLRKAATQCDDLVREQWPRVEDCHPVTLHRCSACFRGQVKQGRRRYGRAVAGERTCEILLFK